ncbi:MAG: hypothetical protein SangKO_046660 [Sandaracinaceae bacterium]
MPVPAKSRNVHVCARSAPLQTALGQLDAVALIEHGDRSFAVKSAGCFSSLTPCPCPCPCPCPRSRGTSTCARSAPLQTALGQLDAVALVESCDRSLAGKGRGKGKGQA